LHKKLRDDGETLYFDHLRSAALIGIVYLRLRDENLIAALLLHDIIEDIPGWDVPRLTREFNADIAELVWWVSKDPISDHLRTKQDVETHFHHKLARAPRRAVIIKLCDRLHNLTTLWTHRVEKIRHKVSETRHFIMPLAQEHIVLMHELEAVLELVEHRYGL
jgi:GTP pyrophosphokinase